jgi:hypothetical protein
MQVKSGDTVIIFNDNAYGWVNSTRHTGNYNYLGYKLISSDYPQVFKITDRDGGSSGSGFMSAIDGDGSTNVQKFGLKSLLGGPISPDSDYRTVCNGTERDYLWIQDDTSVHQEFVFTIIGASDRSIEVSYNHKYNFRAPDSTPKRWRTCNNSEDDLITFTVDNGSANQTMAGVRMYKVKDANQVYSPAKGIWEATYTVVCDVSSGYCYQAGSETACNLDTNECEQCIGPGGSTDMGDNCCNKGVYENGECLSCMPSGSTLPNGFDHEIYCCDGIMAPDRTCGECTEINNSFNETNPCCVGTFPNSTTGVCSCLPDGEYAHNKNHLLCCSKNADIDTGVCEPCLVAGESPVDSDPKRCCSEVMDGNNECVDIGCDEEGGQECSSERYCDNNECLPRKNQDDPCNDDNINECKQGLKCYATTCVPEECAELDETCIVNSDCCLDSLECRTKSGSTEKTCVLKEGGECINDIDCTPANSGKYCEGQKCYDCIKEDNPHLNFQCCAGLKKYGGLCVDDSCIEEDKKTCEDNDDCCTTLICDKRTGTCVDDIECQDANEDCSESDDCCENHFCSLMSKKCRPTWYRGLYIGVVLAVLVLVGAVVFFMLNKSKKNQKRKLEELELDPKN